MSFEAKVKKYGPKLMTEFGINELDAAAVFGNLGHESGGLATLQEIKPTVKGSRGGYGWAQWTGPRRRAYEAYCKEHNLSPSDDDANYAFLVEELKHDYRHVLPKVEIQHTLWSKTVAFENRYEHAGVKNYKSRVGWAKRALAALR
jgi:hypothetical protein